MVPKLLFRNWRRLTTQDCKTCELWQCVCVYCKLRSISTFVAFLQCLSRRVPIIMGYHIMRLNIQRYKYSCSCSADKATTTVDCLTKLGLRMDPLLSAVNLRHWESSHVTDRPNRYTQLIALHHRHSDCSQLPWSSISPLLPKPQYCCYCSWDLAS